MKPIIVAVSGGFDPVHVGHIEYMKNAKALGHILVVIVNGDSWLKRKKGRCFMPIEDRVKILESFRFVDCVFPFESEKDDVCDALRDIKPDIFANGGDRVLENVPEVEVCKELGIEMVFNVGGGKQRSSSDLLQKYNEGKGMSGL